MDPDTILAELRTQVAATIDIADGAQPGLLIMAERFRALDEWLSKGGFLPKRWAR